MKQTVELRSISPGELYRRSQEGEAVEIIDVRSPRDFAVAHVPAARSVPFEGLDPVAVMAARERPGEEALYVICQIGRRSADACAQFLRAGFTNVVNVEGGTRAWQQAGLPVVGEIRAGAGGSLAALRIIGFPAGVGAFLFGVAGRWDLPFFWAILLLLGAYVFGVSRLLEPEVVRARGNPAAGGPDLRLRALLILSIVAHLAVAALDAGRFHWSDTVPFAVRVAGVVGYGASLAFVLWAMAANRFFIPTVRIQTERDHHVVASGPYRLVRHPGYLGSAAGAVFGGLALGSWFAFAPLVGALIALLARTALEDRFLHARLAGYADYAQRVRYRLAPGLW